MRRTSELLEWDQDMLAGHEYSEPGDDTMLLLDRIPEAGGTRSTILRYRGLPLALIEAAELANQHSGLTVPIELASIWRSQEAGPATKRRTHCDRLLGFGTADHFRACEMWLARVQRAGVDRVIQQRRWLPWAK